MEQIGERLADRGLSVATAESLTSGMVATRLGAGPGASDWFKGSVVAYDESVKFDVLGVDPGPVVTATCARQMAEGVRRLLKVDLAVALTGVGGPDESEGRPAGTVYVAVATPDGVHARELALDGDPLAVLEASVTVSLEELASALEDADSSAGDA